MLWYLYHFFWILWLLIVRFTWNIRDDSKLAYYGDIIIVTIYWHLNYKLQGEMNKFHKNVNENDIKISNQIVVILLNSLLCSTTTTTKKSHTCEYKCLKVLFSIFSEKNLFILMTKKNYRKRKKIRVHIIINGYIIAIIITNVICVQVEGRLKKLHPFIQSTIN